MANETPKQFIPISSDFDGNTYYMVLADYVGEDGQINLDNLMTERLNVLESILILAKNGINITVRDHNRADDSVFRKTLQEVTEEDLQNSSILAEVIDLLTILKDDIELAVSFFESYPFSTEDIIQLTEEGRKEIDNLKSRLNDLKTEFDELVTKVQKSFQLWKFQQNEG